MRLIKFCSTGALLLSAACGALDVSDPTAIEQRDVETAQGAELLRRDAVRKLYMAVSEGMIRTGVLSDELTGSAFPIAESLDRRNSLEYEAYSASGAEGTTSPYFRWQAVRHAATVAIPALWTSGAPGAATAHTGEMFAVRGFATLAMAETFCPGFPLHDIVDNAAMFGAPVSTEQAFQSALADLDSAVAYSADSTRILDFARIGRARALLGLGRFAEAGSAVGAVQTAYSWVAEFSRTPAQSNRLGLFAEPFFNKGISVGEREGGNGLDFITANDPRVETIELSDCCGGSGIFLVKYPNRGAPIIWASGIEARLIEAEAALQAGQPQWLTILNELRADIEGLAPLDDPGSDDARVELLFRERAFWLFATNHRLGDLRRLIRHYGRNAETVFPTGVYSKGGVYGTATSIPFPAELETPFNPAVTGCTER